MEDCKTFAKAFSFAERAHANQKRKYTDEKYFSHCVAVSDMIEEYLDTHIVDVSTTVAMSVAIKEQFSDEIAMGVWFLTDTESFVGNRSLRKKLDRDRLSNAPEWVRLIKKFDIEHNSESIKKYDPKFWGIFKRETDELLEAMGMHSDEYYNGPADIQLAF